MLKKDFGRHVRLLRKANNLSQDSLAEQIGVTRQTIANVEKGVHIPKAEIVEDLYNLFKSRDLIIKYLIIQRDKSDLQYLAERLYKEQVVANLILKYVLREALDRSDLNTAASCVFQSIMCDLLNNKNVNRRKIQFVTKVFDTLDKERFIELLDSLYRLSFEQGKKFDAFVTIAEKVINSVTVGNEKSFMLWYQYANALYYQGNTLKAFDASSEGFRHDHKNISKGQLAKVYSRRGLICLQLKGYSEALKAFEKCLELADDELAKYCYLNIARTYYMWGKYKEAKVYWEKLLKMLDENDLLRINVLNDMAMCNLLSHNGDKAKELLRQADQLLKEAKKNYWHMYEAEHLLYRRNLAILNLELNQTSAIQELLKVLEDLKTSHLKDEYELTNNFIVDLMTRWVKIKGDIFGRDEL